MKKLFFVLILLLVVGCGQTGPGGGSGKITGSPDGLDIEFLSLLPPTKIREDQNVDVGLRLTNNGVCDISTELCVTDTLSSVWKGVDEQCQSLDLNGIKLINGRVDKEVTDKYFNFEPYTNLDRDLSTTLTAKARYSCEVLAGPQLCVKGRIGEKEDQCKSFETITGNDLGATIAPITLSKVDKQISPQGEGIKLIADISMRKMSEGELTGEIDPNTLGELGESTVLRYSPIKVEVDYGGYGLMDCRDVENGIFLWRKDRDEEIITCEIYLSKIGFENNPLNVRLNYEYENSELFTLQITDTDRQR